MPLIVGALSLGLMSVFRLQGGVSNRLGNTVDSQVVQSTFLNDASSALIVTSGAGIADCGPAGEVQLLGLAWTPDSAIAGGYSTVVTYADVQNGSQWTLVREYCDGGFSTTPVSTTTVAYNIEPPCTTGQITAGQTTGCQVPANVYDTTGLDAAATTSWVNVVDHSDATKNVVKVELPLTAPGAATSGGAYQYTLAGVPAAASPNVSQGGQAISVSATAGCNFATPGTGYYASSMCLVDFAGLTGNNLLAAENGCLETEVNLPAGSKLFFCIGITGTAVAPHSLPTWQNAFLGNSCTSSGSNCSTGSPFYTGIGGQPALYQTGAGTTTITISGITVVSASGTAATGWWVVGADAESTDAGEWIQWSSNAPINIMSNSNGTTYTYGQTFATSPVGNACDNGTQLVWLSPTSVKCSGSSAVNGLKTGTAMVEAQGPSTWVTSMNGAGLEAMAFGLLLS